MSRPRRNPASPAKRVTVFLDPDTLDTLRRSADACATSVGAVIDRVVAAAVVAKQIGPDRPRAARRSDIIEKGGKEPAGAPLPPVTSQAHPPLPPGVTQGMPEPPNDSAHPGWRMNASGINVCTACGGPKRSVLGKPCPGGPS